MYDGNRHGKSHFFTNLVATGVVERVHPSLQLQCRLRDFAEAFEKLRSPAFAKQEVRDPFDNCMHLSISLR